MLGIPPNATTLSICSIDGREISEVAVRGTDYRLSLLDYLSSVTNRPSSPIERTEKQDTSGRDRNAMVSMFEIS